MKKQLLFLSFVAVLLLSSCGNMNDIEDYYSKHESSLSGSVDSEMITTVAYYVDDTKTELNSYNYYDSENDYECVANSENDPTSTSDTTVSCSAIYKKAGGEYYGYVPYLTEGIYPLYPVYGAVSMRTMLMEYFTVDDIIETESDVEVEFVKSIQFGQLDEEMQAVVTSGYDFSQDIVPITFKAIYNTDKEMFTSFIIDNSDVMLQIYYDNFGNDVNLTDYYIKYEIKEYTEELAFFVPSENIETDAHVNYFDDGDFFGYVTLEPGDELHGELEYTNDIDIIRVHLPSSGIYNIEYLQTSFERDMLYSVYSSELELLFEGKIEVSGVEMRDVFMTAGTYYVVLFNQAEAEGYDLEFIKID